MVGNFELEYGRNYESITIGNTVLRSRLPHLPQGIVINLVAAVARKLMHDRHGDLYLG